AAARGEPYTISFTGPVDLIHADDVARLFVMAVETPPQGARAINLIGRRTDAGLIPGSIARLVPGARISAQGPPLPVDFPQTEPALAELFPGWSPMTLDAGLRDTIDHYRRR